MGAEYYDQFAFTDVARGSGYEDGNVGANEHGIVTGYSSGSFGRDDNIARERPDTMLGCHASDLGMDVTASDNLTAYEDSDIISGYVEWSSPRANYKADTRKGVSVEYLTNNIPA